MHFVKVSESNLKTYKKIAYSCFRSKEDRAWLKTIGKYIAHNPPYNIKTDWVLGFYAIVYEKNKPVGITGIYKLWGKRTEFWLGYFGVSPKERRKGLGEKILKRTISKARRMGCEKFRLYTGDTDKAAHKLYEKLGFTRYGNIEKWIVVKGKRVWKYPKGTIFYYKKL